MPFRRNGYHEEKYLNYLRHCLELSKLEQDVDRLTKSLADALTTVVNVLSFKEKNLQNQINLGLTKMEKVALSEDISRITDASDIALCLNKVKYTKRTNRVSEHLLSLKRESLDDQLTRFLNSPKRFFNELNRLTGRLKKNSNFIITDNKNKFNTGDFAVSNLFNEKFVSISET